MTANARDAAASGSAWYDDPDSTCPTCHHGPRWHSDTRAGCERMIEGWCRCRRFYPFGARSMADYLIAGEAYGLADPRSTAAAAIADADGRALSVAGPVPQLEEARHRPAWEPRVLSAVVLRNGSVDEALADEPPWWSCPDERADHWAKSINRIRPHGSEDPSAVHYRIECGHCGTAAMWSAEGEELDG